MKLMKINLTPHAINIGGIAIQPSGTVARVSVTRAKIGDIDGIPCFRPTFGPVQDLPDYDPDCVLIVSAMVRTHPDVAHRADVASPGALVRDDKGNIIGCDGLDFN
jgi:hypothetical protein